MKKTLFFLLVFIALFSCKNRSTIIHADLENMENSITLDLSDILKNISITQISTEFLLSVNSKVYVTSQYLIVNNEQSLHLFDRSGRHIRKLSERGNGPGEFFYIQDFFTDNQEEILYYIDMMDRSHISRLDIGNGKALDPLPIDISFLETKHINGKIYGLPNYSGYFDNVSAEVDSAIIACSISLPTGEIEKYRGWHKYSFIIMGSTIASYHNEIDFINLGYSDTLFTLQDNRLQSLCVLDFAEKMTDYRVGGNGIQLISANRKGIVLSKIRLKYTEQGERLILNYIPKYYTLYDRKGSVSHIDAIRVMDTEIPIGDEGELREASAWVSSPLPISCGKYGYMLIDPTHLNDPAAFLKKAGVQAIDFDPNNDNPFIIIGEIR